MANTSNTPQVEWWNPSTWFTAGFAQWMGGLGGDIASGFEGGFIAVLKDMWTTIRPFIYIGVGVFILINMLTLFFLGRYGGDILRLGSAAAAASA